MRHSIVTQRQLRQDVNNAAPLRSREDCWCPFRSPLGPSFDGKHVHRVRCASVVIVTDRRASDSVERWLVSTVRNSATVNSKLHTPSASLSSYPRQLIRVSVVCQTLQSRYRDRGKASLLSSSRASRKCHPGGRQQQLTAQTRSQVSPGSARPFP